MSRMTYEKALGIVAERTYDNRMDIRQKNVQRRNSFVDLYGIPHYAKSDEDNKATFYVSISQDYIYLNRFQFRLSMLKVKGGNFRVYIEDEEITNFLKEQIGLEKDEELIEGEGLYPLDLTDDDPTTLDDELNDDEYSYFDVLDIAQVIQAEANTKEEGSDEQKELEKKRRNLLRAGFKKIEITSDASFEVTMYLYLKFSNMNR